ncbi:MAG: hypothetical protein FWG51_05935, partial [Firmicutes bacterium]|nr:hypothetical protein [Bacillota bacterium]
GLKKKHNYFKNWNTQKDGRGTGHNPEETYIVQKNTKFYAIWERYGRLEINANSLMIGESAALKTIPYSFNNPDAELVSIEYYEVKKDAALPQIPKTAGEYKVVITAKDDMETVEKTISYIIIEGDYELFSISAEDVSVKYNYGLPIEPVFKYTSNKSCQVSYEYFLNGEKLDEEPFSPNIYQVKIKAYDKELGDGYKDFFVEAVFNYTIKLSNAFDAYNYGANFYKNADSLKHLETGYGKAALGIKIDIQRYRLIFNNQIFEENMQFGGGLASSAQRAEQIIVNKDNNPITADKRIVKSVNAKNGEGSLSVNGWDNLQKNTNFSAGVFLASNHDIKESTIESVEYFNFDGKKYTYKFIFNNGVHGEIYKAKVKEAAEYMSFKYAEISFTQDSSGRIIEFYVEEQYKVKSGMISSTTENKLKNLIKYDNIIKPEGLGFDNNNWFLEFRGV